MKQLDSINLYKYDSLVNKFGIITAKVSGSINSSDVIFLHNVDYFLDNFKLIQDSYSKGFWNKKNFKLLEDKFLLLNCKEQKHGTIWCENGNRLCTPLDNPERCK